MSNLALATGAGAGVGLQELLAHKMREAQMQQQQQVQNANIEHQQGTLAETSRSHMAEEALRGRQIDSSSADRELQRNLSAQNQSNIDQDRDANRILSTIKMRPIGSDVPFDEMSRETGAGAPSSLYDQAPGDALPNGDVGPPLPKIKFKGTQDQQGAQETRDLRGQAQASQADSAAARLELAQSKSESSLSRQSDQMNMQRERLDMASQRMQMQRDAADKKDDTVKVGEGGKRALRSIEQADPLIDRVLSSFPKDMEDANSKPDKFGMRINQKYNTAGGIAKNWLEYGKYKMGLQDENSPVIQLEKLLQPIQSSQYLAGSRNWNMVELALAHLSDPTLSDAERYSRLKTLKSLMPELRDAIIKSEAPMHLSDVGKGGAHAGAGPTVPAQHDSLGIR